MSLDFSQIVKKIENGIVAEVRDNRCKFLVGLKYSHARKIWERRFKKVKKK